MLKIRDNIKLLRDLDKIDLHKFSPVSDYSFTTPIPRLDKVGAVLERDALMRVEKSNLLSRKLQIYIRHLIDNSHPKPNENSAINANVRLSLELEIKVIFLGYWNGQFPSARSDTDCNQQGCFKSQRSINYLQSSTMMYK